MDVRLINPFVAACCDVLSTMANLKPTVGKPFLQDRVAPSHAVIAAIDITGAQNGTVVFGFPVEIATALTGALLGQPPGEMNADCLDAMGEVANMIAGGAKKHLPGGLCGISTPRVYLDRRQIPPSKPPIVVIPCFTDDLRFDIEVSLRPPA